MRFHPWHLLLAEVVAWLIIALLAAVLVLMGFSHQTSPAPMVTDVQLITVPGDGS